MFQLRHEKATIIYYILRISWQNDMVQRKYFCSLIFHNAPPFSRTTNSTFSPTSYMVISPALPQPCQQPCHAVVSPVTLHDRVNIVPEFFFNWLSPIPDIRLTWLSTSPIINFSPVLPRPYIYHGSISSNTPPRPDIYQVIFSTSSQNRPTIIFAPILIPTAKIGSTRSINLPSCPAMNADTASSIVSHHNNLRSWRQPFMFPTRDGLVDLLLAIGKKLSPQQTCLIISATIIQKR